MSLKPCIFYQGGWWLVSFMGSYRVAHLSFAERADMWHRWHAAMVFADRLNAANGKSIYNVKIP